MEENGLENAVQSWHSSDLAPSDFCHFSHGKHCLRGQSFEIADEPCVPIDAVLRGIEKWTVPLAFLAWMQSLRQCIETNGDYFDGAYKSFAGRISFTR
jgi:hypothetical protein